ncbi:transposase [Atopobium sp. oral taxon 416]|uniref:transposase n=1 Tax=Atopobium sp. oral taxon 416 TaxID=712157 RepID=UPI001BAA9859|nr:transposase [Atopobium sp. oral taxon 416]
MSNARVEATNNKIKLIVRKVYGFRNIQNRVLADSFLSWVGNSRITRKGSNGPLNCLPFPMSREWEAVHSPLDPFFISI